VKKIIKFFTLLFTVLIINLAFSPAVVVLANETESNNHYDIIQNSDTSLTLLDNETDKSVTIDIIDSNNAIYTDVNGNRNELYIDNDGNVYLNGILEATRNDLNIRVVKDESLVNNENAGLRRACENLNYTYLDTLYYDTKTQGDIQSVAFTLLSFIPYIGPIYTVAGIINTFQSLGYPTMYVKVNRYYAKGYQFYKYDSFFYSDPARTNLVRRHTEIKQMW